MARHLHDEIATLKRFILELGTLAEESMLRALQSVKEGSRDLAAKVKNDDDRIDQMELEVEEECLKILALHQPVAGDLRYIVAVLKINNELERIGDLAVNIAERSLHLHEVKKYAIPYDFGTMHEKVRTMMRLSLDSLVYYDLDMARRVLEIDDEVDAINRDMYSRVKERIREDLGSLDSMLDYLSISKYLERIADHLENVAEDVVYMIEGRIVRHKRLH